MPTYFSTGTTVCLSASSLAASTTANPLLQRTAAANRNALDGEIAIQNGLFLDEQPIRDSEGREFGFLGPNQDMPFFMVHAGTKFQEPLEIRIERSGQKSVAKARSRRRPLQTGSRAPNKAGSPVPALDATPTNDQEHNETGSTMSERLRSGLANEDATDKDQPASGATPKTPTAQAPPCQPSAALSLESWEHSVTSPQALTLSVFLSAKSFLSACRRPKRPQDIKIDVFFNGELAGSAFIAARYKGDPPLSKELAHRFSGTRINHVIEQPWVIVPPGQHPDGSLRRSKRSRASMGGAQERWNQIGAALRVEADKQGFDKYGSRSAVGEYLASLAEMDMPQGLKKLQKSGGPKLGFIDVVLSLGHGKKVGPECGFVSRPTSMRDVDFSVRDVSGGNQIPEQNNPSGHIIPGSLPTSSEGRAATQQAQLVSQLPLRQAPTQETVLPTPQASSPVMAKPLPDRSKLASMPTIGEYSTPTPSKDITRSSSVLTEVDSMTPLASTPGAMPQPLSAPMVRTRNRMAAELSAVPVAELSTHSAAANPLADPFIERTEHFAVGNGETSDAEAFLLLAPDVLTVVDSFLKRQTHHDPAIIRAQSLTLRSRRRSSHTRSDARPVESGPRFLVGLEYFTPTVVPCNVLALCQSVFANHTLRTDSHAEPR